ncbi:hypothetical protein F2Q68_00031229 [Brassica cretica]|uniref:Uncharacterized protein n=1 Tax=Brassica cretica TaxID=69181 RepID=A0A8S9G301_BRACR|nr:hypothetical protein F2Q68_00031229 [Brassica cretica]
MRFVHPVFNDLLTGEGIRIPQLLHYQIVSRLQDHNNNGSIQECTRSRSNRSLVISSVRSESHRRDGIKNRVPLLQLLRSSPSRLELSLCSVSLLFSATRYLSLCFRDSDDSA